MSNLEGMNYTPLELPFYEELDWNMEDIISVLEFVRQNLTAIVPNLPDNLILKLTKFNWKGGEDYPIIAILWEDGRELNNEETAVLDRLTMHFEPLESYINEVGLKVILDKSKSLQTPEWESLKSGHVYPE